METVCLQCGDAGFTNAFVYCVRCLNFAVHRYCLDILPKTVDEFVHWICDDCSLEIEKNKKATYDGADCKQSYNLRAKRESVQKKKWFTMMVPKELKVSHEKKKWFTSSSQQLEKEKVKDNLMQKNLVLRDNSREESQRKIKRRLIRLSDKEKEGKNLHRLSSCEESATIDCHLIMPSKKRDHQNFSRKPRESNPKPGTGVSSISSSNGCSLRISEKKVAPSCESNIMDQRQGTIYSQRERESKLLCLEKQGCDMSTVKESVDQNDSLNEIRKSRTTNPACNDMGSLLEELPENLNIEATADCCEPAEPVLDPIWRGSFNVWNKEELIHGLMAHMSSRACEKAYEEAQQFPSVLQLEILPKSDVWPKIFDTLKPSGIGMHIALYFFPSIISETVYDILVDEMLNEELAMRVIVQNAELLVFTSTELQLPYWRFRGKYYLWGVFRDKQQSRMSASQSCENESSGN